MPAVDSAEGVARRFAAALDADDFEAVRPLLAPDCAYDTGKETLIGPDSILDLYRANGASARTKFDRIEYASGVTGFGPDSAVILFTDRVTQGGESHTYRCRQRLRYDANGRIVAITHEELPGEREQLLAFCARHGIQLASG
ncbi:MAG: nuclear transport factor 2 family protein [Gemmataceae bacterium]|nr:nuclear transport factor 2 family protein [Gemmataceae bacterium]